MWWLLRMLLLLPPPRVSRDWALELARRECEAEGWEFRNPKVREGLISWWVWTCDSTEPGSPFVKIDKRTGESIMAAGFRRERSCGRLSCR